MSGGDAAHRQAVWISNDQLQLGQDTAEALGDWQARLAKASIALNSDPEDVTDEEREALSEYIKQGGNPWVL